MTDTSVATQKVRCVWARAGMVIVSEDEWRQSDWANRMHKRSSKDQTIIVVVGVVADGRGFDVCPLHVSLIVRSEIIQAVNKHILIF